jgi:hypothetical protein
VFYFPVKNGDALPAPGHGHVRWCSASMADLSPSWVDSFNGSFFSLREAYQNGLKKQLLTKSHQRARAVLLLRAEARENKLLPASSIWHTIMVHEITVSAIVSS